MVGWTSPVNQSAGPFDVCGLIVFMGAPFAQRIATPRDGCCSQDVPTQSRRRRTGCLDWMILAVRYPYHDR
jgi:hypothetical protein